MIRVGQVVGAFGVRGAVKVMSLTDFPDRFEPGSELYLAGDRRRVEWSRPQPSGLVVKLSGVDDRTRAEGLYGSFLEVPDEELRQLPEGRWYHHQLLGLAVVTAAGRDLGTLAEVLTAPANDVWVARGAGGEHLIPAVADALVAVDLETGRVTVADWVVQVEDA